MGVDGRPQNVGRVEVDSFSEVVPDPSALSSEGRGWSGVEAMRINHAYEEAIAPPLAGHAVVLKLGNPVVVEERIDGRVLEKRMFRGDVTVVPAGVQTGWRSSGRVEGLHVYLDPSLVRGAAAGSGLNPDGFEVAPALGVRDARVEGIGKLLLGELETGAVGGALYAESLANALAVHLLREHSSLGRAALARLARDDRRGLPADALRRAADYVNDNLARNVTLAELAGAANMSPHHFSRLFKRSTGLSPHQYALARRVEKAKHLLTDTDLSGWEVARAAGFASQSHLARHFGRLVGISPARFRREASR